MTTEEARIVLAEENIHAKSHLQELNLPKTALKYLKLLSEALDMADKALEENEKLKAENERLKADRAGLIKDIKRWNEASHEHHENIKKAKEKIENKETYDGIYIDRADVLEILDELTEGEIEDER